MKIVWRLAGITGRTSNNLLFHCSVFDSLGGFLDWNILSYAFLEYLRIEVNLMFNFIIFDLLFDVIGLGLGLVFGQTVDVHRFCNPALLNALHLVTFLRSI